MGSIQEQWLGEPLWGHMVGGNGQSCANPKKKHKQIGNKGQGSLSGSQDRGREEKGWVCMEEQGVSVSPCEQVQTIQGS